MFQEGSDTSRSRARLINSRNRQTSHMDEKLVPPDFFSKYLKNLFDIIDWNCQGFVTLDDLKKHLQESETHDKPRAVRRKQDVHHAKIISALSQVAPANGRLNFQRFSLAMNIALGKADSTRGIGRSLRPKSFLFAVTESSGNETESDFDADEISRQLYQQNQINEAKKNESKHRCNETKYKITELSLKNGQFSYSRQSEDSNQEEFQSNVNGTLLVLEKCIDEAKQLTEWYCKAFTRYSTELKELQYLSSLTEDMAELERRKRDATKKMPPICLADVDAHLASVSNLNVKLKIQMKNDTDSSQLDPSQNSSKRSNQELNAILQKTIEKQSDHIHQLEKDKAALVKELFHMKVMLKALDTSTESIMPF